MLCIYRKNYNEYKNNLISQEMDFTEKKAEALINY